MQQQQSARSRSRRARARPSETLWVGETLAGFVAYRVEPGTVVLVHTDVNPSFEATASAPASSRSRLHDSHQICIRARACS